MPVGETFLYGIWAVIAQIGADRGGFYSYELLENLVGCRVRNADRVHPEWEVHEGDGVSLHPSAPPLDVVAAVPGSHLLAHAAPDEDARTAGRAWCEVTWLFALAPHGPGHCRLTSRYRCAHSADRRTRLAFVAALVGGLHVPALRSFFDLEVPGADVWALVAGCLAIGIALLIAVRRVPALRRIEARGS